MNFQETSLSATEFKMSNVLYSSNMSLNSKKEWCHEYALTTAILLTGRQNN